MLVIFFIGIGLSAMLTGLAQTPVQVALGLFAIGVFAAIYHPVGLAMVVQGRRKTGVPLAVNGIFGNLGVAGAALITGLLIDSAGWRWAFLLPGAITVLGGLAYAMFVHRGGREQDGRNPIASDATSDSSPPVERRTFVRVFSIILIATAIGGLIFQSTTFTLPKVFDERLKDVAASATMIGCYAFLVFAVASVAQLVVGYLVDRYSVRTVFAGVVILQVVFLAAMHESTGFAALASAFAFMLAVFGQIPIVDVLVARITRSAWRSRVYALRYIVTFSVAASAVPFIAWVHSGWGFATLFIVLAVAATVLFSTVLLLPKAGVVVGAAPRSA